MGHIGKPSGYPLQVLAVAVGFTLLSLMRQEVSVAYSFPPFSPFLPPPSRMKSCPDRKPFFFGKGMMRGGNEQIPAMPLLREK